MSNQAPGELEHVRQFVNTLDVETGEDTIADPASLRSWLLSRGLLDAAEAAPAAADVERAVAMRAALRQLLLSNNGLPLAPESVEELNSLAQWLELRLEFDDGGSAALVPIRSGLEGALARLLAIASRAMTEGTWQRLKACAEHTCEAAFYDHSKNRSGTWCDMRVCGNRTKARNYRRRQTSSR